MSQFENVIYPTASVRLDAGMYTRQQLQDALVHIEVLDAKVRAAMGLDPRNEYEKKFKQKPLTQDQIDALCDVYLWCQEESRESSGIYKLIKAVERAHGIGEKDE